MSLSWLVCSLVFNSVLSGVSSVRSCLLGSKATSTISVFLRPHQESPHAPPSGAFNMHWGRKDWKKDIHQKIREDFKFFFFTSMFFGLTPSKHWIHPPCPKPCPLTLCAFGTLGKRRSQSRDKENYSVIFAFWIPNISGPSTEGITQGHFYWM